MDPTWHTIIYLPNPTVGVRRIHHQIVAALGTRPLTPPRHRSQTVEAIAVEQVERGRTPARLLKIDPLLTTLTRRRTT